nr:ParB/RepB/Spo0J family partition protein [Dechloromonas sp.]
MAFKDSTSQFVIMDLESIDPDPSHVRQNINEEALTGLSSAIQKLGVIHPLLVRPSDNGRYQIVVGERRRLAALQAGETKVPVVIRSVTDEEALEIRVFENIGLGVRSALEPRDMANAIQAISERFSTQDEAAQYFGRSPAWLAQATAAANLSAKVTALLDSGKITSTSAAVQLEKIAKKDEAKAEAIIEQIAQLPEGEKVSKKDVDNAVSDEGSQIKRKAEAPEPDLAEPEEKPVDQTDAMGRKPADAKPSAIAHAPPPAVVSSRISPSKVKLVANLLGLSEEDEDALLAKLIDEFLVLKGQL